MRIYFNFQVLNTDGRKLKKCYSVFYLLTLLFLEIFISRNGNNEEN